MISRTLAMPTLLAASVAVPYVATNAPEWTEQVRKSTAAAPAAPAAPAHQFAAASTHAANGNATQPAHAVPPHQAGAPIPPSHLQMAPDPTYSLSEVLRFDITKDWVYQRWERKSTALADLDLFGVRVPLVTGKNVYDIAGSLTYFFGADGRVKRISFRGRTGDTTQLAMLLHQRFGLQAAPSVIAGQQLLQVRQGDDVISELRTQTAPVLWSNSPHESFSVEFELQEPATARPLKPQVASVSTPPAAPPPGTAAKPGDPAGAVTATDQAKAAEAQANETAKAAAKKEEPPPESGWKAFFPRSRASEGQINQLQRSNFYQ